jgi:hypothetical protein
VNSSSQAPTISPEALKQVLHAHLFPQEDGLNTYAVLDGASIPDLLDHLYGEARPEFACLYRGELEPDIAEVAPYLVLLKPGQPFTDWLLTEGWGKHWGIFAISPADFKATQKHFRTFLMVKDPDGKQLYFRYYDPRVLRIYLPTCNAAETATVFGPVRSYTLEDENPATPLRFWPDQTPPRRETINLAQD